MIPDDAPQTAEPDGPALAPEIRALMGVYLLYCRIEQSIEEGAIEPQLSRLESHILIRLDQPRRMGELARLVLAVPSSVTAAADRLEAMGFVRRSRDPQDRRAWLLQLAPDGEAHRTRIAGRASALFREAAGLSAEETAVFAALAGKIHDHILQSGQLKPLKD